MKTQASRTLTNDQIILIQNAEDTYSKYIKQLLNKEQFKHIQVSFECIVSDKTDKKGQALISSNSNFSIKGSIPLDTYLSNFWTDELTFGDVLEHYDVKACLTYKEIEEMQSKNTNQATTEQTVDFFPSEPRYNFTQTIIPESVRNEIFDAIKVIKCKDLIYNQWGFNQVDSIPRSIMNFYGAPGTGKTMCAHAIAKELGKKILCLNYSEIESKYVGEAPKNLKRAFEVATEKDAVLFFDEADSFLGKRIQNVTQGAEQALNSLRSQMLILLEDFDGVVLFATNLVTNFDHAFESRILKHIRFEMPNKEARAAIIEKMIPTQLPLEQPFTKEQYLEASDLIEGLSGREIKNAILDMLLKKATNDSTAHILFTYNDLCSSLKRRKETKDTLKKEEDQQIKEKIIKKLHEQSMEEEEKFKVKNKNHKKKKK